MFTLCVPLFGSIFKFAIFPIGCAIIAIDFERKHFFFFNVNNSITILATCFGWDGDNLSWTTPGIGRNMTRLFWLGFVCVILLLSCEYLTYYGNKVHCMLMKLYSHVMLKNSVKEDKYDLNFYESDVSHEKQVVNGADPHNYCLYLK